MREPSNDLLLWPNYKTLRGKNWLARQVRTSSLCVYVGVCVWVGEGQYGVRVCVCEEKRKKFGTSVRVRGTKIR